MRRRLIPFLCVPLALSAPGIASAQFMDDFSDGDFTANPAWEGDDAAFIVNAAQQLQLNGVVAATSQLHSANAMATLDDSEWRVRVKLAFPPSGSNFARVYLVSDQADLTGALNGYYLQFGEAGNADAIELFEQTGTASASVCRGTTAQIAAAFDVGVQVKRDASGTWRLAVDPTGGTNYVLQASGVGTAHTTSTTIGVRCTYTVSNATKFYFDDFFAGPAIVDTQAPTLLSAIAAGATDVDLRFDEPVEQVSAETGANYALQPALGIASATRDGADPAVVHLSLAAPMTSGTPYTVTATGVQDPAGNVGAPTSASFLYIVPVTAQPGDVVINEIMADPTPLVQLPEAEFVELFNASPNALDLAGWTYNDGGTLTTLPSVVIAPGGHLILCSPSNTALFSAFGPTVGVSMSLVNTGDIVELRKGDGTVIDAVTYSVSWYGDPVKANGGWTLERINPFAPCSSATNWTASTDERGGTPGLPNSILDDTPDTEAPVMTAVDVVSSTEIQLVFNERLDPSGLAQAIITLTPPLDVALTELVAPDNDRIRLVFATALPETEVHAVRIENLSDCSGNVAAMNGPLEFMFVVPAAPRPGDVVINEIMADPTPAVQLPEAEFIELFNATPDRYLDLTGWTFTTASTQATLPAYTLAPGAFVVLANTAQSAAFTGIPHVLGWSLSSTALLNAGTTLTLTGPDGTVIDRVSYASAWYGDDVKSDGGWTLERINPFALCSSGANWTASTDERGGTPGQRNSVFDDTPDTEPPILTGVQVDLPGRGGAGVQ
ncbi:MAG: lamin tail domain-containing protein [Flavobacteriales bacterium]